MKRDTQKPGKILRPDCRAQRAERVPEVMRNERETRICAGG